MREHELKRIQELRYGGAAACYATLIDRKTLDNWLERAAVLLSIDDRREAGERKRVTFTFERIVQIALTAELVKLGVQPRRAGLAASAFTDMSGGVRSDFPRKPGQLFEGAETFLVLAAGETFGKIVPVTCTTLEDLFKGQAAGRIFSPAFTTAIIIKVDDIYHRVAERLKRFEQEKRRRQPRELERA